MAGDQTIAVCVKTYPRRFARQGGTTLDGARKFGTD
jgi:hypothetical protein